MLCAWHRPPANRGHLPEIVPCRHHKQQWQRPPCSRDDWNIPSRSGEYGGRRLCSQCHGSWIRRLHRDKKGQLWWLLRLWQHDRRRRKRERCVHDHLLRSICADKLEVQRVAWPPNSDSILGLRGIRRRAARALWRCGQRVCRAVGPSTVPAGSQRGKHWLGPA